MKSFRPNILHIFVEQQRADTIGALGNPYIKTPNLDKLVQSGVSFTNAYSPSPVCIAARCSMIYGQYPQNTGCYENTEMPTDERETFMGALSRSGYRTHGIGKCHFTPDADALRGFETRLSQEELSESTEQDDYLNYLQNHGFDYVGNPFGARAKCITFPRFPLSPFLTFRSVESWKH
jgi:arylsulfatase A-like enzyme